MLNLQNKKIIIATHVYTTGPAQDLRDFLRSEKVGKLLYIGHPLFFQPKLKGSGYELYFGNTGEKKESYSKIKNNFGVWSYIRDFFNNIKYVTRNGRGWDLYIGSDNLNALSGLVLKRLGLVKKCVYYVIDYNPHRFQNRLMNKIYHKIDQFCVKHCDETWNLSIRMKEGRKNYFNFSAGKQITAPIGIWYDKFARVEFDKVEKHTLVYMGHVLKKQGIQYVIEAIPAIIKEVPNFNFLVIGGGEYLADLKNLVDKLRVSKNVKFTGFVEDHREVEKMLSRCAAAIAMYERYDEHGNLSFTYFADPGKLKSYLAGGLPILLTDVSHNAKEIEKLGCGKIITPDKESIAKAVVTILKNESKLEKMRQNALKYARWFDWNLIFDKNLKRVLYEREIKMGKKQIDLCKYGQYKKDIFKKLNFHFQKGKKILDVGCGDGSDAKIFINEYRLRTSGIDIYEDKKIHSLRGFHFKKAGIYKIPFKSETFDYVFLHDILHHIDEKQQLYSNHIKGLRELKRVCKKNGYIIIVEGNRFNPLFYPHMVLLKKHNHFKQSYFRRLISKVFPTVHFISFEAHLYPPTFLVFFKFYESIMEKVPFLRSMRAYNVAIVRKGEADSI